MSKISLAFRAFFGILFGEGLPAEVASAFGYVKDTPKKATPAPAPVKVASSSDGALQVLGIMQRDSRLIDFLMEDISAYSDDQIGAAVRDMQQSCGESLRRYVKLAPVIDGVEGTYAKVESAGELAKDNSAIKLLGNVPANGKAAGGTLRHKGWRAEKVDLPTIPTGQNTSVIAPAEIEIE